MPREAAIRHTSQAARTSKVGRKTESCSKAKSLFAAPREAESKIADRRVSADSLITTSQLGVQSIIATEGEITSTTTIAITHGEGETTSITESICKTHLMSHRGAQRVPREADTNLGRIFQVREYLSLVHSRDSRFNRSALASSSGA